MTATSPLACNHKHPRDTNMNEPPYDRLRELLSYDPITGHLTWLVKKGSVPPMTVAGYKTDRDYIDVAIDGKTYAAHRIAWVLHYGAQIPDGMQIDHINGVKDDNRIKNLRLATHSQNFWNKGARKNSKSGLKGATYHSASRLWAASITVNGTVSYLGYFKTATEAHEAYKAAASVLHKEFAHHNRPPHDE